MPWKATCEFNPSLFVNVSDQIWSTGRTFQPSSRPWLENVVTQTKNSHFWSVFDITSRNPQNWKILEAKSQCIENIHGICWICWQSFGYLWAIELFPPNKANSWKYPICLVHGLIACLRGVQGWPAATDRHRGVDGKIRGIACYCVYCVYCIL